MSRLSGSRARLVSASGFGGFGELTRRVEDLEAAEREHQILDVLLEEHLVRAQQICRRVEQARAASASSENP